MLDFSKIFLFRAHAAVPRLSSEKIFARSAYNHNAWRRHQSSLPTKTKGAPHGAHFV